MKYLIFLLLLAGCASVKKTATHTAIRSDSVVTATVDTSSKVVQVEQKKTLQMSDITFRILYGNGDTVVKKVAAKSQPVATDSDSELSGALAAFNFDHSGITEIDAHIGDVRILDDYTSKTDSSTRQATATSEVKKSAVVNTSTESRINFTTIIIVGGIVLLLVIVFFVVKRFIL